MDVTALLNLRVFVKDMVPSPKSAKLMDARSKRKGISKECAVSLGFMVLESHFSLSKTDGPSFVRTFAEAHFREISASSHVSATAHQENESQSSSHDTSSIANDSSYQNSNDVAQQSVNCYSNTFYDPLPHPNASFANSPMDWTNQASHYGPYPPDFAPQLQPFPYQQQYPSQPQPWMMPSTDMAAPTTMEIPYVYYEPGSSQRNTFSPEAEPLEPICDATSFLRRDSMASSNLQHHQERRHPPPRYFTHPGGDAASGHNDELSLQDLEFPDDEDLSVIGGPHTEV
jgi:hypothetical protein